MADLDVEAVLRIIDKLSTPEKLEAAKGRYRADAREAAGDRTMSYEETIRDIIEAKLSEMLRPYVGKTISAEVKADMMDDMTVVGLAVKAIVETHGRLPVPQFGSLLDDLVAAPPLKHIQIVATRDRNRPRPSMRPAVLRALRLVHDHAGNEPMTRQDQESH